MALLGWVSQVLPFLNVQGMQELQIPLKLEAEMA